MSMAKPAPSHTAHIVVLALITAIMAAPIIAALIGAFAGEGGLAGLFAGKGFDYAAGTLMLCGLVGLGATALGAGAASLICLTDFPGRRLFAILLAMPFAIPAYVSAYTYGDVFSPIGTLATIAGPSQLPEIRSLPGAAFILTLAVYPYIYLAMAASLSMRSGALLEAARMLGASPIRAVWAILIGAGRPALAGGLALALMETAADYGVADYFGVATLSVGIFRTWYGLGDLGAATQLAGLLFFTALIFIVLEEAGRKGLSAETPRTQRAQSVFKLSTLHSAIAIFLCAIPVIAGFLVPAGVLFSKLGAVTSAGTIRGLEQSVINTALVAGIGAILAIFLAIFIAYAARRSRSIFSRALLRISTLGYAIPGAVIAIGILALSASFSEITGTGVAAGILVLIYAYAARFITAAYNAVSGGLSQISKQMDAAAKTLGATNIRTVMNIHWPQARGAVLAGTAIVAIDIIKELPATLLLRPFNFETLATRVYRLASDERLADAAPAAILLIIISTIPVLMISFTTFSNPTRRRDKQMANHRETNPDSDHVMPFAGFQDSATPRR